MNDGFAWWLVVLGIAIGIGIVWLFTIRLPRDETDVDETELRDESSWISGTIEAAGGIAPVGLVQEVLDLHREYLTGERGIAEPVEPPEPDADAYPAEPPPPPPEPHATGPAGAQGNAATQLSAPPQPSTPPHRAAPSPE